MRCILVLLTLSSSVAAAHPCDELWPDACVDPSVVLASDVAIGSGVDLGPYLQVEAGVVFAGRSTVAGREVGTQPVRVGVDTVFGRRTSIGFDASIGGGVSFFPQVSAGRDLSVADNVVVGVGVVAGDGVRIGEGAAVGSHSLVADHVSVAPASRVARWVTVGEGASVAGYLGPGVSVGAEAELDADVRVNSGAVLGDEVRLGESARVGRSATVERRSDIGAGARIRAGASVCEGAVVDAGQVIRRNETFPADGSCAVCDGPEDCASGVCDTDGTCASTCDDGTLNGDETGVDCGGPECTKCAIDITCDTVTDCLSGFCGLGEDGSCGTSVCFDGAPEAWGAVLTCTVSDGVSYEAVSYTHLTLPTTPYV